MSQVNPQKQPVFIQPLDKTGYVIADVFDLTNSGALAVGIVDGNGNQITNFGGGGGGTQYVDGTTQATPTGTVALGKNPSNVLHSVALDSSGNLLVNVAAGGGSGGTSSSFNATFPGTGTAAGAEYLSSPPTLTSGQMVALQTDVNGNLKVTGEIQVIQNNPGALNATITGTVQVGNFPSVQAVSQSGSWSVGQSGTWNVDITNTPTVTADQGSPNNLADAWTIQITDTTNGPVAVKAASTPAGATDSALVVAISPNNTVAVTQSGSWTVNTTGTTTITGSVSVSNFPATQPVSGTVTANQGTANATPWNQNIAQFGGSSVTIGQQLAAASIPVVLPTSQITTLTPPTTVTVTQSTAANLNATVTGSVSVSNFPATQTVSGTVTANQGTANTASNAWPHKITDGTNIAAVKAASTAAGATDPALVVAISPNNTVAVTQSGTWNIGTLTSITNAVTVSQGTAANLNATVVGTGTFAVQAAQSGNWPVRLQDGSGNAITSDARGSERPLAVEILDASGNQITSFGGGTQYAEGSTVATATGTVMLGKNSTTVKAIQTDASGNQVVVGTGTFAVQAAQSGNFTTRIVGNSGATLDQANGSATPTNGLLVGGGSVAGGTNFTALTVKAASTAAAATDTSLVVQPLIGNSAMVTAGAGIQKVGISGASGAQLDQTVGTGTPLNVLMMGGTDGTDARGVNLTLKGTQGTYAVTTQELKDSGRQYLTFTATAAAGVTSETLLSMSQNLAGTVTGSVTSYVIPSGKTFRIEGATISVRAGAAAVPFSRMTLRSNTTGATIATSPVVFQFPEVFGISATTGVGGQIAVDIPDGLEITGNGTITIGVSHLDQATTNVINFTLYGYLY